MAELKSELVPEIISVEKIGSLAKMSNDLARAYWTTKNVWELRIVTAVSSLVRSDDEDFRTYRIPLEALCRDFALQRNYTDVKDAIEALMKRTVKVIDRQKPKNFLIYNVFAKCGVVDGDLVAGFHPDLKPLYLNLQREFTLCRADDLLRLPSSYSQKLYLFLKSWANNGEVTVKLAELYDRLDVTASLRKLYSNFKNRVLVPCHRHILDFTGIQYEWEEIKHGRAVESIKFKFEPLPPELDRRDEQDRLDALECREKMKVKKFGGCPEPAERRSKLACAVCIANPAMMRKDDAQRELGI